MAGVGNEEGEPLPLSPDGMNALLEVWPVFEAFQAENVAKAPLLDAKNAAPPLPTGPSAGARAIARLAKEASSAGTWARQCR